MSHPILPRTLSEAFAGPDGPLRASVAFVLLLTALRVALLFASPLELYPDEAQYWVWSRHLAFGYFSKPPMIAWLIHLSTAIGGNGEAWVRLPAPLMHGLAAMALAGAGRAIYGGWSGFWAAVIYSAMSGVQLSCAVIATDAPLLAFLSLALWAYGVLWARRERRRSWAAVLGLGLALGLAFLSKYAALYIVGGMAMHAILDRRARAIWSPSRLIAIATAALAIAAPNIAWNAAHHFQTLAHTAANADIGGDSDGSPGLRLLDPRGPLGFILGQFGVFGPVMFAVLVWAVIPGRRSLEPEDWMLVWLGLPALVVVFAESILARANANWAVAAYAPGAVLAAGLLMRWRAWKTLGWGLAVQAFIALVFVVSVLNPALTDAVGAGNAFKRARGWKATADGVVSEAARARAGGDLSAVGVDDRFMFNALSYYARDAAGVPAGRLGAPLRMWVRLARPANQAEAETPLDPPHGARVLMASVDDKHRPALIADFGRVSGLGTQSVELDSKHQRKIVLLLGTGFNPKPRLSGPATRP